MHRRYSTGLIVACALILAPRLSIAQDATSGFMPIPDPISSPGLVSPHQIAGKTLIQTLQDLENTRASTNAANSWPGLYGLLVSNWQLAYKLDKRGGVVPMSARLGSDGDSATNAGFKSIPKEVALLGMAIRLADARLPSQDKAPNPGPSPTSLPSSNELDLICGQDWIISWLEDEDGNVVPGSTELYCGGTVIPL